MDRTKLGCVYLIKCLSNNKVYVGQTIDIKRRKWEHTHELELNIHRNHYLQEDYNKYGSCNFIFNVVEDNITLSRRRELETYYINLYGGIESDTVYNFQDNITENAEMRKLVSENQKGKKIKQESIDKMRRSLTGRKLSEEHKQHIKDSCVKFIGDKNPAKRSEVRQKISQKVSGKGNGMYGKRKYTDELINQLKEEYNITKTYISVARKFGINSYVAANLIKFGETYNPSIYLPKRKFND